MRDPALSAAIEKAGGVKALADALKITRAAVFQWKRTPIERVFAVEEITGVSRKKLRPDIFLAPKRNGPSPENA